MDNDFGTPEAVAVLFDLAVEVNRTKSAELAGELKALGGVLGILQGDPKAYLQAGAGLTDAAIQTLIAERAAAKANKDFARADEIRKDLAAQGVVLKDAADWHHLGGAKGMTLALCTSYVLGLQTNKILQKQL